MYINILQQAFEDGKRILGNIERNKPISLWMAFPSKRCGWISIVDLTVDMEHDWIKAKFIPEVGAKVRDATNFTRHFQGGHLLRKVVRHPS